LTGNGGEDDVALLGGNNWSNPSRCVSTLEVHYALKTWFPGRRGWPAHGGVRQGRAGVHFPNETAPARGPAGGRPDAALAPQRERAAPDSRRIPAGATASADLACFFVAENIPHATEEEAQAIWDDHLIWPQNYDEPVSARYWYDWFDLEGGPCAKAYRLLEDVDLGPDLGSPREGPHLAFEEGAYPGDNSRWVQASGKLALSLLQARLIDLRLPLQIAEGR
jgi:hypothetical protein